MCNESTDFSVVKTTKPVKRCPVSHILQIKQLLFKSFYFNLQSKINEGDVILIFYVKEAFNNVVIYL